MSSCLAIYNKNFLLMCADSATCYRHTNKELYRINEKAKKIHLIDNKIIFLSGVKTVADNVLSEYKQKNNKDINTLQKIMKMYYEKYKSEYINNSDYNLGAVIATWEKGGVVIYTIDSAVNDFEIEKIVAGRDFEMIVDGIKKVEVAERAKYYFETFETLESDKSNKENIFLDVYKKTYDAVSYEGIGGILTVYAIENGSIGEILKYKIKEKHNLKRWTGAIQKNIHCVKDNTGKVKLKLGNYDKGKYGLLLKNKAGTDVILSEDGLVQTDTIQLADNVDEYHPLKLKVYVDDDAISVKKVKLAFSLEKFRAYSLATGSGGDRAVTSEDGGGDIKTTSNEDVNVEIGIYKHSSYSVDATFEGGDPPHSHSIPNHTHELLIDGHSHKVDIPDHSHTIRIPSHTHDIQYGIYESTTATGVDIIVNGVHRLGKYYSDQNNIDLTPWIQNSGWQTVELTSTRLGRINASLYIKSFTSM